MRGHKTLPCECQEGQPWLCVLCDYNTVANQEVVLTAPQVFLRKLLMTGYDSVPVLDAEQRLGKAPLCFKWMYMSAIAASILPERQHDRGANSVSCGDHVNKHTQRNHAQRKELLCVLRKEDDLLVRAGEYTTG